MGTSPFLDRRAVRGGIALVATLQYLLAETVTAMAWPSGYSYADNFISDLGVPECLVLDRVVCSPQWLVMDAAFVVQGLIAIVAIVSLSWLLPRGWRIASVALGVAHAVGIAMVGVFPGSVAEEIGGDPVRMQLHGIGALLAIVGGNLWALVSGLALARAWRGWGLTSIGLGALGIAAAVAAGWTDLGLGPGGIERVAVYPIIAWLILTGFAVLVARRGAFEAARIRRAQEG